MLSCNINIGDIVGSHYPRQDPATPSPSMSRPMPHRWGRAGPSLPLKLFSNPPNRIPSPTHDDSNRTEPLFITLPCPRRLFQAPRFPSSPILSFQLVFSPFPQPCPNQHNSLRIRRSHQHHQHHQPRKMLNTTKVSSPVYFPESQS